MTAMEDETRPTADRTNKKAGPRSGFQASIRIGYFFLAQVGAADLIGAGLAASFCSHLASMALMTALASGFWQLPAAGFGATTGVVGVVGVVVPVPVVPVPPPVTTAAERLAAAPRTEAKAR